MVTITQDMRYRLSLIKYADKFGVTKAAIKYKTNRQYIYRWKRRYDGSWDSLRDRSRRPHHHPNQHTDSEIRLISDMRRRNPNAGLVVLWVKLRQRGYQRSIPGLYRFLRKQGIMAVHPPNPKYIPKPYEKMDYPGQRIQVDVKFVPSACLKNSQVIGKQFFQYTAIDEFSRWRFVEAFEEHNTYSSAQFVDHLVKAFPCTLLLREEIYTYIYSALPPIGKKPPFSRNTWKCTGSATKSFGPILPVTMGRWNVATGRTMNGSTQPTCFIPLRISQNS